MGYIGNAGVTTPFLDLLSYPLVVEERSLGMHWHEMSREGAGVQLIHCTMFYWCLDPGETTTFQVSGRCLMAPQALMTSCSDDTPASNADTKTLREQAATESAT